MDRALGLAAKHADPGSLREEFQKIYFGGHYFNYGQSQANEIVSKGLAIFAIVKGAPKQAIIVAVNFGRDTDCLAAVAGGLAGAFSGPTALPPEWPAQVDAATREDPYTNCGRTIAQTADGLHAAFLARRRSLARQLTALDAPGYLG